MKMNRVLVFTPISSKGVPPQALLIEQMLAREGYPTVVIGKGETGFRRLMDVAWRGLYWMPRGDVAIIDVFGHRAFLYEAIAILYGKLFSRRVVAMLRGGWLHDFMKVWPRLSRWVLEKPDLLLSPHAFLAEKLKGLDLKIDQIIPNIIQLPAYQYRERKPLEPRFLYLRGAHAIYNPEMCLRAFALIQARYPEASLTFAGNGSQEGCKALVRELKLSNVSFVGLVPKHQIPELADRHDIYFQSNRVENMPITVLEMWACGVAVVGTDVGGMPYLVRHEDDGLLVPSEDYEALADACCRLLEDHELALRLVRNGRARVEEYTWEKIRHLWHDALQLDPPGSAHQLLAEKR